MRVSACFARARIVPLATITRAIAANMIGLIKCLHVVYPLQELLITVMHII
jgi:hypothetical protein